MATVSETLNRIKEIHEEIMIAMGFIIIEEAKQDEADQAKDNRK